MCDFLSRGVRYEPDSWHENFAYLGFLNQRSIQFMTTNVIISAILYIGSTISAAVSGGSPPGVDSLAKELDNLRCALLPNLTEAKDRKAAEVKKLLEHEVAKGPIQIRPMGADNTKGRVRRGPT